MGTSGADRYASGELEERYRLRSVSLEDRSRLRPVNGTSAGRSLEACNLL
jgi:hypothetical protein